jgi:hypothetical protein
MRAALKRLLRSDDGDVNSGSTPRDRPRSRGGKGRCQFTKRDDVWTLRGNCATNETVAIPRGIALDGAGRTISLTGDAEAFVSVGVRVSQAAVRNLTIDGRALAESRPGYLAALVIDGPAVAENVTVANIRFGDDRDRAAGIEGAVFDGARVELRDVLVSNIGGTALLFSGTGSVVLAGGGVRDATREIQATPGVRVAKLAPRLAEEPSRAAGAAAEMVVTILFHPCHEIHRDLGLPSPALVVQGLSSI